MLYLQSISKHPSVTYFPSGWAMEDDDDSNDDKADFEMLLRLELAILVEWFRYW